MDKENMTPSLEANNPKQKRTKIEAYVLKVMSLLDPAGDNTKRWKEFFASLDDRKFAEFMELLRKKDYQINLVMPNMKKPLKMSDIINAAAAIDLKLAHRLWLTDKVSGRKYLTNERYLVLTLPIRRAQQEWDKKLSVPSRDKTIDSLTGQVVGDDKGASLSNIEIQSLGVRGLKQTMLELVRVRGGDVTAYGDFKRQLQESGHAEMQLLNPNTRVRSADIAKMLLRGMMIDSNI